MIKEVPGFLLHLSPQVTLVKSGTTAYLDSVAGIERPYKDQLFKKISDRARLLGPKTRELISRFANADIEQKQQAFIEKLKGLPTKDGKPDFGFIDNPQELGKAWAQEIYGTEEQRLEALLKALDEPKNV